MLISANFYKIKQIGNKHYGLLDNGSSFDSGYVGLAVSTDNMDTWEYITTDTTVEPDEYIFDIVGDDTRQVAVSGTGFFYATDGLNFTRSTQLVSNNTVSADNPYAFLSKTDEGYWFFNGTLMMKSVDGVLWETIYPYLEIGKLLYNGTYYFNFNSTGVSRSLDLVEWEYLGTTELYTESYGSLHWVNGRFISRTITTDEILTSVDGVNIDTRTSVAWTFSSIIWDGTRYVAFSDAYNRKMYHSTDAITWTEITTNLQNGFSNATIYVFFNSYYYVISNYFSNPSLFRSSDLVTWTPISFSFGVNSVAANDDILVITGNSGYTAYSTNGTTFTEQLVQVDTFFPWYNVVWSGTKFYISASDYSTNPYTGLLGQSVDGINWTVTITPYPLAVVVSNGDEVLADFIDNGFHFYSTSLNSGNTWNLGAYGVLSYDKLTKIFYHDGLMVGHSWSSTIIKLSTDGGNVWSILDLGADYYAVSISYIEADAVFMLGVQTNDGIEILTTTDFETFSTPIITNLASLPDEIVKSGSNYIALSEGSDQNSLHSSTTLDFWVPRSIYSADDSISWNEYSYEDTVEIFNGNYGYVSPILSGTSSNGYNTFVYTNNFSDWNDITPFSDSDVSVVINNTSRYIVQVYEYENNYTAIVTSTNLEDWDFIIPYNVTENTLISCNEEEIMTINPVGFIEMFSILDGTSLGVSTSTDVGHHASSFMNTVKFIDDTWFAGVEDYDNSEGCVWKSSDGLVWEKIITLFSTSSHYFFLGKLGAKTIIVPMTYYSNTSYYSSTDNITWIEEEFPAFDSINQVKGAVESNGIGVVWGDGNSNILSFVTTDDLGTTWEERELPFGVSNYDELTILPIDDGFCIIVNDGSHVSVLTTEDFITYTNINVNPPDAPPSYSMFVSGQFNNLPVPSDIHVREDDDRIFLVVLKPDTGGGG